ncbi:uncharacterized protein [Engystomops pustulosus]|uniref:uncharacterized protein n=1 Tax=Engystomops pustulosus TaxID=76066 RepID=UPI003AFA8A9C
MAVTLPSAQDGVDWIFCTYCMYSPVPAAKSCLVCEASVCDSHLTAHSDSGEHVLVGPITFQENIKGSVYRKISERSCSKETHPTVEAVESGYNGIRQKIENSLKKLISNRDETEKKLQGLQRRRRQIHETSMAKRKKAAVIFGDIRRHLEDLEQKIFDEIFRQEKQASLSVYDLIQKMELEKEELTRKICHIQELCHMTNPQEVPQDPTKEEEELVDRYVDDVHEDLNLDTLYQGLSDIVTGSQRRHQPQERADILLDVHTAPDNLRIGPCSRTASITLLPINRPETPGRFRHNQVLSRVGFSSGRHYWDAETDVSGEWRLGVAYNSVDRDGDESWIGSNSKSWCLWGYYNRYYVSHDRIHTYLPYRLSSHLFRVYLDYEAGKISFYELCGSRRHLYTFSSTFTEPLHAAFYVGGTSWIVLRN